MLVYGVAWRVIEIQLSRIRRMACCGKPIVADSVASEVRESHNNCRRYREHEYERSPCKRLVFLLSNGSAVLPTKYT